VKQKRLRKQTSQSEPVRVLVIEKANAVPFLFLCSMKSPAVITMSFTLECLGLVLKDTRFL